MQYFVRGWKEQWEVIPLSEEAYTNAKTAKAQLVDFVAIEDTFDQFIENYLEYEADVLQLAQRQLLRRDPDWSAGQLEIQRLNRRIVNMLSSGRLYQDFVPRIIKPLQNGDRSIREQWEVHRSAQYDRLLGHRAMETLRNYVQHRAAPIAQLTSGGAWMGDNEDEYLRHSVVPLVSVKELDEASHIFSKSGKAVVRELAAIGALVPLTPLIREYVEGLGVAHEALRRLINDHRATAESTCDGIRKQFNEQHGTALTMVHIVAMDDAGKWETDDIFEDLWNHYHDLARKNNLFGLFSRRFATGQCPLKGKKS